MGRIRRLPPCRYERAAYWSILLAYDCGRVVIAREIGRN